jgi:hypothetical protein
MVPRPDGRKSAGPHVERTPDYDPAVTKDRPRFGTQPDRVFAVDWSGAIRGVRRKIWIAEVHRGKLVDLSAGRDRTETIDYLVERATREPDILIGLDFAFSFPAWFLRENGATSMPDAWDLARLEGERWLRECPQPFWGKPGHRMPESVRAQAYRITEREHESIGGASPKSVFQIGGAGAVGTGSIRGMPELARLRAAGFAIWPHDPCVLPLVIEIYPRYFTGRVTKGNLGSRQLWLQRRRADFPEVLCRTAESCEDAFDAAASALFMARCAGRAFALSEPDGEVFRLEGRIWRPRREPWPP